MKRTAHSGSLVAAALWMLLSLPLTAQWRLPPADRATTETARTAPFFPSLSSVWFSGALLPASAVNDVVHAIAEADGELYAAGEFTFVGDMPASYVARWDGSAWKQLGAPRQGTDGPIETLLVNGDKLYIGGNFTQAGGIRTRNIAVWDRRTDTWSALEGGVGGTLRNGVHAIAVHDGQVFVGGSFIAAGTTVAAYIARWDGRRWHRVGTGTNAPIHAFHQEGDYLYAGGDFTIAGDVPAQGIARYSMATGAWESIGVDIPGSVKAIAADDRYLYVGGVFDFVEGREANNIIRIDKGTGEWSPMYRGLFGYDYNADGAGGIDLVRGVEQIIVEGGQVYVSGTLTQAYVQIADEEKIIGLVGFARWDGRSWSNMTPPDPLNGWPSFDPSGTRKFQIGPPNIYALHSRGNGTLMLGGEFEHIRNLPAGEKIPSPFLCTFSIADSLYGAFGNGTVRKDDPPTITAFRETETREKEQEGKKDPVIPRTRNDLIRAACGYAPQQASATSSLPSFNAVPVPDDRYWQPVEAYTSNDNGVLALASDGSEIYAGGTFTTMFGVESNGIAVYRDRGWWPLDDGSAIGTNGYVYAIAVSGSKVYVGGQFTKAGGVEAKNIAVWDRETKTWSPLGSGVAGDGVTPAFVSEIVLNEEEVYIGGNFTTAGGGPAVNVARWDGAAWSALGSGINGTVNALEFFRGRLYAGGSFSQAGEVSSTGIAFWDGGKWNGMEGGVNGYVNDLVVYVTDRDTLLALGGLFTRDFSGEVAGNLLWWDGDAWAPQSSYAFPAEQPLVSVSGEVRTMLMIGNHLYVGGAFLNAVPRGTGAFGAQLDNVAFLSHRMFNGSPLPVWNSLRGGLRGNVNAMAVAGSTLMLGGEFTGTTDESMKADHLASWDPDKHKWVWAGNPTALSPIQALALYNDTLYAAGSFTSQDVGLFNITNYLVHLTPLGWRLIRGDVYGSTFALNAAPGNELLNGGSIISTDKYISVNIARWNAGSRKWAPLTPGSGVASLEEISFVSAIASDQENIYVGGSFNIADTFTVSNVARWNRATQTWHPMGKGLNGTVYAMALDAEGTLYAGGSFSMSGGTVVNRLARWNGTEWLPVGGGVNGNIFSLAADNGILYVGGRFDSAGPISALNIARYDPEKEEWSNLGSGLSADFEPVVNAVAVAGGQLFAAGKIDYSGTDSMHYIARWNPAGWWMPLGSGTDRIVNDIAADPATGSLFVGGQFFTAGQKDIRYVGMWTNFTLAVREDPATGAEPILQEGYPNPFTAGAAVRLVIPDGPGRRVRLELFDPAGRKIRTVADGPLTPGGHTFEVNGENLPAGIYVLRMQCGENVESVRLVKW